MTELACGFDTRAEQLTASSHQLIESEGARHNEVTCPPCRRFDSATIGEAEVPPVTNRWHNISRSANLSSKIHSYLQAAPMTFAIALDTTAVNQDLA